MSGIRAQAKRKLMFSRNHIHLVGGIGRVKRGSIVRLAIRWPTGRAVEFGWLKADKQDPPVHFGFPDSFSLPKKLRHQTEET